ncbi:MAG: hypothetical protein WCP28_12435 [Actinomycetes bacterium]
MAQQGSQGSQRKPPKGSVSAKQSGSRKKANPSKKPTTPKRSTTSRKPATPKKPNTPKGTATPKNPSTGKQATIGKSRARPVAAPEPFVRPANALLRCLGALALVWVVSFGLWPVHLTALAAAAWVVATLILVPIGPTLTDRIVAFILLAAAPAVLIAWFTPLVPWLVSPPVLTGLLGSLAAVAWGFGWTRRPKARLQDWVTVGIGALTAVFFWIPFAGGGLVRAVGLLTSGYDQQAHYFMWMRVWANHGYLLINTLADPDYWDWRAYPQGAHALLANVGSVLTAGSNPPANVDQSVALFAILGCLVVGTLALVAAWSVDRLSRSRTTAHTARRTARIVLWQVLAALAVAVGPGSVIPITSSSFAIAMVLIIPGLTLAATARNSPRRSGILLGASLVAATAAYPVCALLAVLLWPLYLWTSRGFWLASVQRRRYAVIWTVAAALLCAPMWVLLALRKVDSSWDTWGYFQVLNRFAYVGVAIALAVLIVFARGRLSKAVEYTLWVAAATSVALVAEGALQWLQAGDPSYYTIKTMYLAWMLSVIAVCAGFATVRLGRTRAAARQQNLAVRSLAVAGAAVLLVGSLLISFPLARIDQTDIFYGTQHGLSKQWWLLSQTSMYDLFGARGVGTAQYASQHNTVTVVVPCLNFGTKAVIRWGIFLNGGMDQTEVEVLTTTCGATTQSPLGNLPSYLQQHPSVAVSALTTDPTTYQYALQQKAELKLANLEVVPPPGIPPVTS